MEIKDLNDKQLMCAEYSLYAIKGTFDTWEEVFNECNRRELNLGWPEDWPNQYIS